MITISVNARSAGHTIHHIDVFVRRGIVIVLQNTRKRFIMWLRYVATWVSPPGYYAPVDRGAFLAAWKPENVRRGVALHNDKGIYSEVLEVGRKRGAKAPPPKALHGWLQRHPSVFPGPPLAQRAYLLSRLIKRRGQRPRLVATNALDGIGDIAERAIEREIDNVLARL